jgi:probable addiction module antidote protein
MTTVYRDWINGLRDHVARARIQVRVDRLVHGNPGSHRALREGVSELKIDIGPGYRVYFTEPHPNSPLMRKPMPRATTTKSKRSPSKAPRRGAGHTHTVVYDVSKQLRTPKEMAAYLEAWLVEAPDDAAGISRALGDIARAVGMNKVAKQSGLSRESLYKALSEDGNPSLDTILRVARAVGVRFHASAA